MRRDAGDCQKDDATAMLTNTLLAIDMLLMCNPASVTDRWNFSPRPQDEHAAAGCPC